MNTFLIIAGSIIVAIVALGAFNIYRRAPKTFSGGLKPLEKLLFHQLQQQLNEPEAQRIPQQIARLTRGCRYYNPKSYHLELYENKANPIGDDIRFKRRDEFKLATITFSVGTEKFGAEFKVAQGRVYDLIIRPGVKHILGVDRITIEKFKLNNDPSEQLDLTIVDEYFDDSEIFSGDMSDLKRKYELKEIKKPLPEKQRKLFIRTSETKFPIDYLDLLQQTNGFTIGDASVSGFGNHDTVTTDSGNYITLAESKSGVLSVKQSKRASRLIYFSYDDEGTEVYLGEAFLPALEEFLKFS